MKQILLSIFAIMQLSAQMPTQLFAQALVQTQEQALTPTSTQEPKQAPARVFSQHPTQFKSVRNISEQNNIILGIEMLEHYLPLLKGKRVAVVVNQTSVFPLYKANSDGTLFLDKIKQQRQFGQNGTFWQNGQNERNRQYGQQGQREQRKQWQNGQQIQQEQQPEQQQQQQWRQRQYGQKTGRNDNSGFLGAGTHLVDTLLSLKIQIKKIFSPEHGFRGGSEAGANIKSSIDSATGLPVISLYGKDKKPSLKSLKNIDVVVFDLQDVGTRFYTYISTLQYVMEACAEAKIPLIVLDRPNPNGYYVDGPVLDTSLRSFVGMQPIPIVHGLTICEYALMLKGEKWVQGNVDLTVIPMKRYNRNRTYQLAVKPSPNLSTMNSILYYPSLCLFEGTAVSVGRGTRTPFMCYGFPKCPVGYFNFTPVAMKGISENPPYKDIQCKGFFLDGRMENKVRAKRSIMLEWLIEMYNVYPDKDNFFNSFFDKLAGTKTLQQQIKQGRTADEIRTLWKPDLDKFKAIRKKYLLYEDIVDGIVPR
ncbi:MAG: DUF1343 domain-containing protein [Bacteroidales bacterium]|jgi:uncharacterized protein YbbC (DUF1343 family)|nr:DUF1343 domain-containing protein [Bacteroidales bacterium]